MSLIDHIKLIETCGACPEQYDAELDGKTVGYLRLRHGYFSVRYPDVGGEEIFGAHTNGDGCFDEDEREHFLDKAKIAIAMRLSRPDSEGKEG